jgi:lysozyme family protein
MANYYLPGYTPPSDIGNAEQVKALQQKLGVKTDGMWGPQTQAAYDKANGSSVPSAFSAMFDDLYSMIGAYTPSISYAPTDEATIKNNIASYLRPAVDQAIANRGKQTVTNKANIDADAAARGMGASTWVTDVKNRQQNAEASDVATMESNYGATLAQQIAAALAQEKQNQLTAQQYNAAMQNNALSQALSLAGSFYNQSLADQNRGGGSGSGDLQAYIDALLAQLQNQNTKPTPTTVLPGIQRGSRMSGVQN